MASIGHVMVGMAAARLYASRGAPPTWRPFSMMVVGGGLSLLPDADAVGFALGVAYEDPWGHRGATHSIVFALAIGLLAAALARRMGRSAGWAGLVAGGLVLSHPLLDMLTDGGLGCGLFWPLRYDRLFWPWRPLPVAPIGADFFTMEGLPVALTELWVFAPFVVYALWPGGWGRPRQGALRIFAHDASRPGKEDDHDA